MKECLFCRIVDKDIPSNEVFANETVYAFDDIEPVAPVHVLVVPRLHIENVSRLTKRHNEILFELFTAAQKIAQIQGISSSGYRLVFNIGKDAMNSVPHLHMHVIGGRQLEWPPG